MPFNLGNGTELSLGDGSKDNLERWGREFDSPGEKNLAIGKNLAITAALLKIRNRMGKLDDLIANEAQRQYTENAWRNQRNIVLKARQMGITTWIAGQFFLKTILQPGTVTVQVAHTQEAAEQIFRIVHRFFHHLPAALREGALKSAKVSARRLLLPELDSEYLVETAGDRNAGRGLTITNLHCTELARWPGDAAETLYGLMATLSPAGALVMESTPMGATGCFWNEWREAEKTKTIRHFFPWWLEPAYKSEAILKDSLTEEEAKLMEQHAELTLEKIAYRRQIREKFRGMAKQEYAEDPDSCFLASGSCYFEVATIDERLKELTAPVVQRRRGSVQIWLAPQKGKHYLVSVDPAGGGTAGDYTAMQVINLENGIQCAELQDYLTPSEAAVEAARLGREYNNALLAVERNSLGQTVLSCLARCDQPYPHLFVDKDASEGFLTTAPSRDAMLSELYATLEQAPRAFLSERLLRECRCFIRTEKGRLEAKAGEHDDLVMSMAIALAARHEYLTGDRYRRERAAGSLANGSAA
ncbi:MAG TPA: hypothetical protein VME68_12440 [Acidobacteriaceae bacterium]|nr:hypothetical protein [Acidobacteriaceae bacterium]